MPRLRSTPRLALTLLLLINLFNYIDRYILAALFPAIQKQFHVGKDIMGWLVPAFLLTYMLVSPLFGFLADRFPRWPLIGVGVLLWSLASGATGLASTFAILLLTRCLIGVGEGAYGPAAPTLIADLFPLSSRGKVLAFFYAAIPFGGALGYAIGGLFTYNWHHAFLFTVPPGLLLGAFCLLMKDPPRGASDKKGTGVISPPEKKGSHIVSSQSQIANQKSKIPSLSDYAALAKIPSYLIDTLGMTLMTFAIGGISVWMPTYLIENRHQDPTRANLLFGAISAAAGILATLLGGIAGDKLRPRFPGSYFLVSALGMIAGFPLFLLVLVTPFPACWVVLFAAVFCLFFNTGPSNTILANVTPPSVRASAFALNIFILHLLGDASSPWVIGKIATHWSMPTAFVFTSFTMLLGGLAWLLGIPHLAKDTARATAAAPPIPTL